jgi:F0F1-type ATP synthase epsilon subunit
VFGVIAAHKQIMETVMATAAEIRHSTEDEAIALEQGVFAEQNSDELDLFVELTEAVQTTLAGVVALVTHLDEVNKSDPWKFEDNYATPLIGALATAFNRMAVAS